MTDKKGYDSSIIPSSYDSPWYTQNKEQKKIDSLNNQLKEQETMDTLFNEYDDVLRRLTDDES